MGTSRNGKVEEATEEVRILRDRLLIYRSLWIPGIRRKYIESQRSLLTTQGHNLDLKPPIQVDRTSFGRKAFA